MLWFVFLSFTRRAAFWFSIYGASRFRMCLFILWLLFCVCWWDCWLYVCEVIYCVLMCVLYCLSVEMSCDLCVCCCCCCEIIDCWLLCFFMLILSVILCLNCDILGWGWRWCWRRNCDMRCGGVWVKWGRGVVALRTFGARVNFKTVVDNEG